MQVTFFNLFRNAELIIEMISAFQQRIDLLVMTIKLIIRAKRDLLPTFQLISNELFVTDVELILF